jgi:hypothetical protein
VCFYIYTTYIITYATTVLGFGRGLVLNMVMAMAVVSCFANPLFGHLSDRYGRRTIIGPAALLMIVFPFVYFRLLDTDRCRWSSSPSCCRTRCWDNPVRTQGPQAAFTPEAFPASDAATAGFRSLGRPAGELLSGGRWN